MGGLWGLQGGGYCGLFAPLFRGLQVRGCVYLRM